MIGKAVASLPLSYKLVDAHPSSEVIEA